MTTGGATVSQPDLRAGTHALGLLAVPLNSLILRALAQGTPQRQIEIRRQVGSPAQSTLRSHLNDLETAGLISRRRQETFPGTVEFELLEPGADLRIVAAALERWLGAAPDGALDLGSEPARAAIRALVEGWSTTILRALAANPLSLTELARLINDVSYPSLERRLETMRVTGQLKVLPSQGRGTPHAVTAWLRRGVAPLAAAAQWEQNHNSDLVASIDRLDVEAAFLLAVPLLQLDKQLTGECRLSVELPNGGKPIAADVLAQVGGSGVTGCVADREDSSPTAWICGSAEGWLCAVIEADTDRVELGGDKHLAKAILEGLHGALFGDEAAGPRQFLTKN